MLLTVSNLKKDFNLPGSKEKIHVLKGVNLEIPEGEFHVIMGPSGSGKSTLLNILSSIDVPSDGYFQIHDLKINTKISKKERINLRRNVTSIVFQSFNILDQLTALENVVLPLTLAGVETEKANGIAMSLLDKFMLSHRYDHLPGDLSGGEKQRVAIARALANDPKLILADEPTGNLDSKNGLEMIKIFKELVNEGKSILMVTHDPELAKHAHKIWFLRNGQLVNKTGDQ